MSATEFLSPFLRRMIGSPFKPSPQFFGARAFDHRSKTEANALADLYHEAVAMAGDKLKPVAGAHEWGAEAWRAFGRATPERCVFVLPTADKTRLAGMLVAQLWDQPPSRFGLPKRTYGWYGLIYANAGGGALERLFAAADIWSRAQGHEAVLLRVRDKNAKMRSKLLRLDATRLSAPRAIAADAAIYGQTPYADGSRGGGSLYMRSLPGALTS